MNDAELNRVLLGAHLPERSAKDWNESAQDTARAALMASQSPVSHQNTYSCSEVRKRNQFGFWAAGIATACIVVGFMFGHWHAERSQRRDEVAEARKLFNELSAMFPNQLEAVVLDGSAPRLQIAETPHAGRGTPLFVRICGKTGCQRVITFSGERVRLNGGVYDVLVDARGHIIIAGESFAWSSAERTSRTGGYQIEAAPLTGVL